MARIFSLVVKIFYYTLPFGYEREFVPNCSPVQFRTVGPVWANGSERDFVPNR
jgi:hypothetical protein